MFSIGPAELFVIIILGLLILGPKRLPEVGKAIGQAIREFKKSAESLQKEVEESVGLDETSRQELKQALNLEQRPDSRT